jgi:hypothetical protein
MGEFYTNLKILSQDLYKKSSHTLSLTSSTVATAPSSTPSDRRGLPGGLQRAGSFSKGSVGSVTQTSSKVSSSSFEREKDREKDREYFSPMSLQERLKQYVRVSQGIIPMEYIERYVNEENTQQQSLYTSVPVIEEDEEEKIG